MDRKRRHRYTGWQCLPVLSSLLLGVLVGACARGADTTTTPEENKQIVRRAVAEGVNAGDLEVFREMLTPDYVRHSQATTERPEIRGVEEMLTFLEWNFTAFPDWHEEIELMVAEGDKVAYITTGTGTHTGPMGDIPPTGKKVEVVNFIVQRIEGGKIAETWVGWDNLAVLMQLGLYRPPDADGKRRSALPKAESFAREWLDAWDSHDVDRILTYYTEDAFYEDVPTVENGWGVPSRGHRMIRESLVAMFEEMSDLGFELVSASGAGDRMVVEWVMTGTHYRDFTGRFSIRGVSVIELEGDRIASVSDYYDAYLLLSQLGMVPALDTEQPRTSRDSATR